MVKSEVCRNACVLLTAVVLACGLGRNKKLWSRGLDNGQQGLFRPTLRRSRPDHAGQCQAALKQVCELQFNEPSWFSSGLLMVGRTLYASTMRATYAVNATSCEPRWRHVIALGTPANVSSRGVGYLDGVIFRGTVNGRVIALDAGTGRVLWDVKHADPAKNKSFVSAPIAWDGKVFIGIAISDLGIRGRIMAIDAKTGNEIWRFYTVPANDESGPAKWGGGGFWSTFTLDPQRGEILAPVANPAPDYNTEVRPGDNLYTNSIIALDAASGKLNWFYQVTPHDDHDWDYGTAPTLYRTRSGRDMVAAAGKNGYVLGLDRATRAVVFNTPAEPVSNNGPITWDMPQRVCPGLGGGAQFTGAAYSPVTGALYVGMVDWCSYYAKPRPKPPAIRKRRDKTPNRCWTTIMKAPLRSTSAWIRKAGSPRSMARPGRCAGNIKPMRRCWREWSRPGRRHLWGRRSRQSVCVRCPQWRRAQAHRRRGGAQQRLDQLCVGQSAVRRCRRRRRHAEHRRGGGTAEDQHLRLVGG